MTDIQATIKRNKITATILRHNITVVTSKKNINVATQKKQILAQTTRKRIVVLLNKNVTFSKPAGIDKNVQFNDGGVFNGFGSYDKTNDKLSLNKVLLTGAITENKQAITKEYFEGHSTQESDPVFNSWLNTDPLSGDKKVERICYFFPAMDFVFREEQDYTEIDPPRSEVFRLESGQNFTVKLPMEYYFDNALNEILFERSDNGVDWHGCPITKGDRWYNHDMGNNEDPLLQRCVWAFRCNEPFDSNMIYRARWDDYVINEVPVGRPFAKDKKEPNWKTVRSDNIYLRVLPSHQVYELYRWVYNKGASDFGIFKKSHIVGAWKEFKEGFGRFKLLCRGDIGEHTLKEITSRLTDGFYVVFKGQEGAKWKTIPFKFGIYDLNTGARTQIENSPAYGLLQNMNTGELGLRRILMK